MKGSTLRGLILPIPTQLRKVVFGGSQIAYGNVFIGIHRRIRCGGIVAVAWLALASGTAHAQAHFPGVQERIPATEYQALVDLYNSAGGTNWYYQTGWLDPSAIAWTNVFIEGVVTDANGNVTQKGHVTFLGLSDFNMRGTIPASIGSLSALTALYFDRNYLSGSIPASLGNLSALRTFSLWHNQLCGTIPSSLGNLTSLTYLNISENNLLIDTQGRATLDSLRSHATVFDQPQGTCPCSVQFPGVTGSLTTPPNSSAAPLTLKILIKDGNNVAIPGSALSFDYRSIPNSGGHNHDDALRPKGNLVRRNGPPEPDGSILVDYTASNVAGQVTINVSATTPALQTCSAGPLIIDVKVSNLQELGPNVNYVLTGVINTSMTHLRNHYGTPPLNIALVGLANNYAAAFNGDKLSYNDMSLVWGGLFDCNSDCEGTFWNQPHKSHNLGLNADVGIVPPARRGQFIQMAWDNNLGVLKHGNHWHLTYGNRGYCKISNGRLCSPTNPPLNSGNLRMQLTNVAAASGLTIQVTPQVTHSSQTGLYTYQYSVRNDASSSLEMSGFQILLGNAVAFNLQAPQGWTASLWNDTSTVAFAATEIGSLPPNYVDDGNLVPSPYQIKPGQTLDGFSFQSPNPPGTVDLLAQGFNKIPDFVSEDDTQQPELFDGGFTGTTSGPAPMQLLMEALAAQPPQVAALDSVLFLRDPFPVVNPANLLNQGLDRNTRVILFLLNLQLAQGAPPSSVVVNLVDSNNQVYDVAAEEVRPLANFNLTQVIFRLPDTLSAGTCTIKIKAHGQVSNLGTIRIKI